ncbi:MAG: TlyA family RNA methyltransferase [Candidatus Gastranaerophilales bacterium]|nr:TlyA family RNA methyltransferase [Candidatus Gastranaerophilales bacterium]
MKKRLDLILFEHGYFDSKNSAQVNILAGNVKINDVVVSKAGELYDENKLFNPDNPMKLEIKTIPYVSRGGLKLKGAIDEFNIDLKGKICIDIGASTGGFTDCMLQEGAKKVYAVDVGYGQIAWKLRSDERVRVIEKVNVKNCTFGEIFDCDNLEEDEMPEFLSMDLSFISIKKVLLNVLNFTAKKAEMVLLIKPQFEAEKNEIAKGGVVKDEAVHKKIIEDIKEFARSISLETLGVIKSPIQGAKQGNTEYLIYLRRI